MEIFRGVDFIKWMGVEWVGGSTMAAAGVLGAERRQASFLFCFRRPICVKYRFLHSWMCKWRSPASYGYVLNEGVL